MKKWLIFGLGILVLIIVGIFLAGLVGRQEKYESLDLCQKTSPQFRKQMCKNIIEKDIEGCETEGRKEQREECLFYVAIQTEDLSVCERIYEKRDYETYLKSLCKALVKKNANLCEVEKEIGSYGGHWCYLWLALKEDNPSICARSQKPIICRAIVEEKPKLCKEVGPGVFGKKDCYYALAAITENSTLCNGLDGNEIIGEKAACIRVANRNIEGVDCKQTGAGQHLICELVAILEEKPSICEKKGTHLKSFCYESLAYVIGNVMPKNYIILMKVDNLPSIETVDKTCDELGGEVCQVGQKAQQFCQGGIGFIRTFDSDWCCTGACKLKKD